VVEKGEGIVWERPVGWMEMRMRLGEKGVWDINIDHYLITYFNLSLTPSEQ